MKLVVAFCVVAAAMAQTRAQTGEIDTLTGYHTDVPNRRGADAVKSSVNPSFPNAQQADALATSANTDQEKNAGQLNNPNFKVLEDKTSGIKYDFAGRVAPDLTQVKYSPRDAKECCKAKCGGNHYCEVGCDMWMAYSSLNWEPNQWRTALRNRCMAQCLQPRRWAHAHEKAQHQEHNGKQVSKSYWHQDKFSAMRETPVGDINSAEQNCQSGCSKFEECQIAQADNQDDQVDNRGRLYISEYVEGSWYNKAIELTNPTGSALSLDGVVLHWHHNGKKYDASDNYDVPLTGKTIPAGGTFVLCRHEGYDDASGKQIPANKCDMQFCNGKKSCEGKSIASEAVLHTGNDAVELLVDGTMTDIIGEVGVYPGSCWKDASGRRCMTKDKTIRRKASVATGNTVWTISEWDIFDQDTISGLGQ